MRPSLHRPALAALLALAPLAAILARARAEDYWLDGYEVGVDLKPQRESLSCLRAARSLVTPRSSLRKG